ncbi:hypothetical protein [Azospirillum sp.]|uniref:hypothetical protein n=1 Tax=Azospirillum sp. TaxID=34012 RepID=UPI0026077873|nr:hypothetical protein [Azospirillum sp.]
MYHPEALAPIVAFLRDLGVGVEYGEGAHGGFLPGVNIHGGVIHVDPGTLVGSGDLLHEAGHIIFVPRRFWGRLGTDLQAAVEALAAEEAGRDEATDARLKVAVTQGEWMAHAWSYAAALHLGVSPSCIFFPSTHKRVDYEGTHPMQLWLERGTHYGPLYLAQVGMTGYSGVFAHMGDNGLPPFPHMTRWTVD